MVLRGSECEVRWRWTRHIVRAPHHPSSSRFQHHWTGKLEKWDVGCQPYPRGFLVTLPTSLGLPINATNVCCQLGKMLTSLFFLYIYIFFFLSLDNFCKLFTPVYFEFQSCFLSFIREKTSKIVHNILTLSTRKKKH